MWHCKWGTITAGSSRVFSRAEIQLSCICATMYLCICIYVFALLCICICVFVGFAILCIFYFLFVLQLFFLVLFWNVFKLKIQWFLSFSTTVNALVNASVFQCLPLNLLVWKLDTPSESPECCESHRLYQIRMPQLFVEIFATIIIR